MNIDTTSSDKLQAIQKSIGRKKAIQLSKTKWWESVDDRTIAIRQMQTAEMTMPFDRFQEAAEKAVGHPVWTHEFATRPCELWQELNQITQ